MTQTTLLKRILEPDGLRPFFQPIVQIGSDVWHAEGVECLMRGPISTNMEPANVLFEYVRLKREEIAVDHACIAAALRVAPALPADVRISINVHASTLGRDSSFCDFLERSLRTFDVSTTRLTIEVVEHAPPWDNETFMRALDCLRELGVRIALDDVGLGLSNFKMILDVHPDYLKIDRYFIQGCHLDPDRQAVIEAIQHLASRFGAHIVAEGVETQDEMEMLAAFGITLQQGYLFSPAVAAGEIHTLKFTRPSSGGSRDLLRRQVHTVTMI